MQGKIIKGIAGFYYVKCDDGITYECKAKGVFRKDHRKPLVGDDVYMDTFQSGDPISIVLKSSDNFHLPEMSISVLYVIRNADGKVLSDHISREVVDWKALWYDGDYHNCELDLPSVPTEAGEYSVSIYFNSSAVTSTQFTIS